MCCGFSKLHLIYIKFLFEHSHKCSTVINKFLFIKCVRIKNVKLIVKVVKHKEDSAKKVSFNNT